MKKILKTLLGIIIMISFLILPFFVFAQEEELNNSQEASQNTEITNTANLKSAFKIQKDVANKAGYITDTENELDKNIISIIRSILSIIGIIFTLLIIYSGFRWMISGGDENSIKVAKENLIQSIVGLVIVVSAYAISYFVINLLSSLTTK